MKRDKLQDANYKLGKRYGITLEEKKELFEEQHGMCAVCNMPLDNYNSAHTEHNHKTKVVRGLVHSSCNMVVGWIESKGRKVRQAELYLESHKWLSELKCKLV